MELPKELFLSHSSLNGDFVGRLADTLSRHRLTVWYSKKNILGARQWHDEIGAALARCDWFLVILSTASVESKWVKRELLFALQENRFTNRIVPLLYEPCDFSTKLSWVLPSLQIVNFEHDFESGCRDLLTIWGLKYRPAK
jgi:hypothetical protein